MAINLILGTALGSASTSGGGVPAPYPPPSGYRWEYVTENGITVPENGQPTVELVRAT